MSDGRLDPEPRVPSSAAVGISAQKSELTRAIILSSGRGNAATEREHLKSFRETARSHAKPRGRSWTEQSFPGYSYRNAPGRSQSLSLQLQLGKGWMATFRGS